MRTSHFANIQPSVTSIASTPDTILYVMRLSVQLAQQADEWRV